MIYFWDISKKYHWEFVLNCLYWLFWPRAVKFSKNQYDNYQYRYRNYKNRYDNVRDWYCLCLRSRPCLMLIVIVLPPGVMFTSGCFSITMTKVLKTPFFRFSCKGIECTEKDSIVYGDYALVSASGPTSVLINYE